MIRRPLLALAAAAGLLMAACGGAEAVAPTCSGEQLAVGDGWVSPVGKGRRQTDSYVVSTLLFDSSDGERLVMENFNGAMAGIPATAMDGYLVWSGYRVDLVEEDVGTPEDAIGPCHVLSVSKLPADWEPPGIHDEPDGH